MEPGSLADLLEAQKDALLVRWRERMKAMLTPTRAPDAETIDSLPLFIDEIVRALKTEAAGAGSSEGVLPTETARAHGAQRFHVGFSLDAVVREYDLLRECILDCVEQSRLTWSWRELRTVFDCLARGVADAVSQYIHERDAETARLAAEQFAFVAHELRNPLSSAVTAVEVLAPKVDEPRARRLLEMVKTAHTRISRLLERVLLEHRLRATGASVALDIARVPIAELAAEAEEIAIPQAEEKEIRISLQIEPDLAIDMDRRLVRSALGNLIANAVKFTRVGGVVTVRARVADMRLLIEVEDECGGLPPGAVERLFAPHVQMNRNRSGFGLGLAIVKQAIEAHDGTVQVRNLPPHGCVFMIDMPAFR